MVKAVRVGIQVDGAKKAQKDLDGVAKSADKTERGAQRLQKGVGAVNSRLNQQTKIIERDARAWDRLRRAQRRTAGGGAEARTTLATRFAGSAAGGLAGVAGGPGGQLLGAIGGFAGEAGRFAGVLGAGAAAIGISAAAIISSDRRRVESAGRVAEAQNQLANTLRQARQAQAGAAAGAFGANRQTIERLQFLLGAGGVGQAQRLQREGFGTAPQALIALQKLPEELRFKVLEAAKAASRLGGGTLADVIGGITTSRARVQGYAALTAGALEQQLGVRLGAQQRRQIRRTLFDQFAGRRVRPFGADQDRLRRLEGQIEAARLGAATDVPRVETGLREQLVTATDPINAAIIELSRATEDEIRVLEAKVKAQGILGEAIGRAGVIFGGEGSAEQQRNRRIQEIGAVTR